MAKRTTVSSDQFGIAGFLWRWLAVLVLVMVTFNPSGYSAYHWVAGAVIARQFGPVQALVMVILLIGWVIACVATWRAMDTLGVVLVALALAVLVWLLVDLGVLSAGSVTAMTWVVLICLATVLAIGMSWSHVWRRLTGQMNVDDVDD